MSVEENDQDTTFWETIVETWETTISGKMGLVNPANVVSGLSMAYFVGLLVPIMVLQQ